MIGLFSFISGRFQRPPLKSTPLPPFSTPLYKGYSTDFSQFDIIKCNPHKYATHTCVTSMVLCCSSVHTTSLVCLHHQETVIVPLQTSIHDHLLVKLRSSKQCFVHVASRVYCKKVKQFVDRSFANIYIIKYFSRKLYYQDICSITNSF